MKYDQAGFTLIEILVSIALLGLVMIAILTPMLGLFSFSRTTEDVLDVNTVAQQRLEEARALVQAEYSNPSKFKERLTTLGVACKNIGLYGDVMQESCYGATAVTPPLRRLSITASQNGRSITAVLDVTQ